MQEHGDALLSAINRPSLHRYLSIAAAVAAGVMFVLREAVDIAKRYSPSVNRPTIVLSLPGTGSVSNAIYWLCNRYGLKPTVTSITR